MQPRMQTMCGRYTIRKVDLFIRSGAMDAPPFEEFDEKHILPRFDPGDPLFAPHFNAAPTQTLPVLRLNKEGKRELVPMRWGLVPSWAKEKKIGNSLINARAETVGEKPAFRSAFQRRRCLIPADGFYEWKRSRPEDGPAPKGGTKTPYFIHLKSDEPFVFAGLWEFWPAEKLETFTILTTTPNEVMTPLHDRMPVILSEDRAKRWTDPDTTPHELRAMLAPFDSEQMDAYPVSTAVNSPRNESPDLILPARER